MKQATKLLVAVLLAGVLLAGCGVAHFDDSSGFNDPFSSQSQSVRTDYVSAEEIEEMNTLHNDMVAMYNEGADIMYNALDEGVELSEGLEDNYRAMADTIQDLTDEMQEKLIDMTEAEAAVLKRKLQETQDRVQAMRESLAEDVGDLLDDSSASAA